MTTGIYKILNKINGKFYIGSAINIEARWRRHRHDGTFTMPEWLALEKGFI